MTAQLQRVLRYANSCKPPRRNNRWDSFTESDAVLLDEQPRSKLVTTTKKVLSPVVDQETTFGLHEAGMPSTDRVSWLSHVSWIKLNPSS